VPRRFRSLNRRGAVVVLVALFLVVIVAMLAFALDVGFICRVQSELQNAADAAALAGAHQALVAAVRSDTQTAALAANITGAARKKAEQLAGVNQAGGVSLSLPTADIVVGYESKPGPQPISAWQTGQPPPNCVQVSLRRDATANGPLPLIFGPVLGTKYSNLSAIATAAFNPGRFRVTGFKGTSGGSNPKLLPIAISVETWNHFMNSGLSPDGQRHDGFSVQTVLPNSNVQPPSNVTKGADLKPELTGAYPLKTAPGNYGLVQFNSDASQAKGNYSDWILNGPSALDLAGFGPNGLQATPEQPAKLEGGTGLKSSLVSDFAAVTGQPRAVPIYSSYSGSGNGAAYTIVGFVGVTIVNATGSGSHINIVLQPSVLIDPTATVDTTTQSVSEFVYPQIPVVLVR
jgi:Flp pilus assembly protein TadG